MKSKRFGFQFRNSILRKMLFWNRNKALILDEIREYGADFRDKWWEVYKVSVSENSFSLNRELVISTPVYSVAWDLVKDERHEVKK